MCILFSDGRESNVPQCTAFPPKTHTTALRWLTSETKTAISTLVPHCHSLWLTKQNTRANIGSSALIQKSCSCNVYSKYFLAIYKLCVTNKKKKHYKFPQKITFCNVTSTAIGTDIFWHFFIYFFKIWFHVRLEIFLQPCCERNITTNDKYIFYFFIYLNTYKSFCIFVSWITHYIKNR